jgi:hypothetical protein
LSLWLRELTTEGYPALQRVLEEVGARAKERGLTPDVLEWLIKRKTLLRDVNLARARIAGLTEEPEP